MRFDRIFILHADHEQNASTSTVRLAGSSGANPLRLHFGRHRLPLGSGARRRQRGLRSRCWKNIQADVSEAKLGEFIKKVKNKDSKGVKLMGFGHRVYKNYDPRAKLMRETCHEVLDELGLHDDPLFKLAMALEKVALEDEYFVSRKLYPNVDFYSGIVQSALGIPTTLFTAIFALARTVGWIAQWNEMIADPEQKIGRPRQLYVGSPRRDVTPIAAALNALFRSGSWDGGNPAVSPQRTSFRRYGPWCASTQLRLGSSSACRSVGRNAACSSRKPCAMSQPIARRPVEGLLILDAFRGHLQAHVVREIDRRLHDHAVVAVAQHVHHE